MKSKENLVGAYVVLAGVIIAIILGVFQTRFLGARQDWIYGILAIFGIIIGIISVGKDSKDVNTFLLASISLVIVSYMGQTALTLVGDIILDIRVILNALLTMFIPATIVVALKSVFSIASIK